ncbi:hypothetical protein K443DRAFT_686044 [Laccaria amethystina LaAM-08-1]|uniref:Uncharacterized protein n=1 Tax=Laccaria amethystina LaAM-08-1 TaxID=1095629 RepID=A0A0C9WTA2_9AGAR|nr:hypothetical protein K443DRAFT_686044 [Laccaria amethystina LaAM-08-1]
MSTFCYRCNKLNLSSANFFFVISIPNLASPPPSPLPASFPAPALVPTNASSYGLTLQLTTACRDSFSISLPAKRLRRWSGIDSGPSESRCVVRFMVVMCWVVS